MGLGEPCTPGPGDGMAPLGTQEALSECRLHEGHGATKRRPGQGVTGARSRQGRWPRARQIREGCLKEVVAALN